MSIPERCKWTITKIRDGYCLIKNVYNGKYLYVDNDGLRLSEFLGTEGTVYYRRRVWRYAGEGYYGISSSSTKMELNNNFKIDICMINAGESIIPTINKSPDNALWAEPTDFKYVGYDDTKIFYSEVTGRFTSILTSTDTYSTQITATHKITGISKTFSFVVNPKAILLAVKPNDNRDRISWPVCNR